MTTKRTLFTTLAVCAGLAALPASALASTATSDGSTVTLTGTAAAEQIGFEIGFDGNAQFSDSTAGPGCAPLYSDGTGADCPLGAGGVDIRAGGGDDVVKADILGNPVAPGFIRVDLGDGDDSFDARELAGSYTVAGGAGNDTIKGSTTGDVLDGGPGNDTIDGLEGADVVRGGDGDDTVNGDSGGDVVDGGPGVDTSDDWSPVGGGDPALSPPAKILFDGAANDGLPGEGDNVSSVERIHAGVALDYTGDDGANVAIAAEVGASSSLRGLGGDDQLQGGDRADTIDGGAGADTLTGGFGNDTITGGPGRDRISADRHDGECGYLWCKYPWGNDTVYARDGEADSIDCGIGQDTAYVDAMDTVANCEKVIGAGSNGNPDGGPGGGDTKKVTITIGKAKLAAMASKGLKVKVACAAACTAKGTITADKATARKLGTRKLAKGAGKAASAGTATVKLKASKSVARKLRRMKSAKGKVKITVKQAGKTSTISRKVTLKR
jgi:hypothetical protein